MQWKQPQQSSDAYQTFNTDLFFFFFLNSVSYEALGQRKTTTWVRRGWGWTCALGEWWWGAKSCRGGCASKIKDLESFQQVMLRVWVQVETRSNKDKIRASQRWCRNGWLMIYKHEGMTGAQGWVSEFETWDACRLYKYVKCNAMQCTIWRVLKWVLQCMKEKKNGNPFKKWEWWQWFPETGWWLVSEMHFNYK